jgi:flagellar biogenesis protein FliO
MIELIAAFLHRNLVVVMAVFVLPMKWGVVRICRDREAEGKAIMTVPEDLCYVAFGLVLGDVINSRGAFHHHFQASPNIDLDLFVTVGFALLIAIGIHVFGRWSVKQFDEWRAASAASSSKEAKDIPNSEENFRTLTIRHMFLFLLGYGVQLAIILGWIHWIAKVISESAGV